MTATPVNSQAARDVASLVHPYTNLDSHVASGPQIISSGSGVYVYDDAGTRFLEGMSGLWCASLGFSEARLADAAARQMQSLPYYQLFVSRSTDVAIDLASELLSIVPSSLSKVLFATSGSEANDQAIKLVWYYFNALGKPRKKKIIARERAYHGVTVYTSGLTGLAPNHADFDLPLGGILRTHCPSFYNYGRAGETETGFVERIIADLEAMIIRENPDTIGAFIAEPINAAGGVIVPPDGYFPALQKLLKRYDILLIVDEVVCGFGRTGNMFGCDTFGIEPDIMTVAKALSAAYAPISATLMSEPIFEAMRAQSRKLGGFGHGYTYSGHPLSAAIALETLRIYRERDIVGMVRAVAPHLHERLAKLADHPFVGEVRGAGLLAGIQMVKDKDKKSGFLPGDGLGPFLMAKTMERGVIVRASVDALYICPPLIIKSAEIDELFDAIEHAIDAAQQNFA